MITCISYKNTFTAPVPRFINTAPLSTWVIRITVSGGIYNTDCAGLKWSNIDKSWKIYSKYNSIADACNHNQMMND